MLSTWVLFLPDVLCTDVDFTIAKLLIRKVGLAAEGRTKALTVNHEVPKYRLHVHLCRPSQAVKQFAMHKSGWQRLLVTYVLDCFVEPQELWIL